MVNNNLIDFKKISLSVTLRILVLFALTGLGACASTGKEASSTMIVKDVPPNVSEVKVLREQFERDNQTTKKENKEYVVRLIPERRDSLWRIAEYEHIYKNPGEWKRIYEANKNIIKDPHLIYPNQRLIIPPLEVELDLE